MTKTQLELYHDNLLFFSHAIELAGGNAYAVLDDSREFLETLARNGLKVSLTYDPSVG